MIPDIDIHIDLVHPVWSFIVCVIFSIGLAVWHYRSTIPPLHRYFRIIFIILRATLFCIIFMMLFQMIIQISFIHHEKAVVALLIDHSSSMQIKDDIHSRAELTQDLLQSSHIKALKDRYKLKPYLFGSNLFPFGLSGSDSILFNENATNLSKALTFLQEANTLQSLKGVLLISDGSYTHGKNPVRAAETLKFPVYSITVGEKNQNADVVLMHVLTNELTYIGHEIPIHVSLRGPGYQSRDVTVTLMDQEGVLDHQVVTIPHEGLEKELYFRFKAKNTGIQKLSIEVSPLENELSFENNKREIYIKVLESKKTVFLWADAPSPDLAFIKRILSRDPNISLIVRTRQKGLSYYEGHFLSQEELRKVDVLILMYIPSSQTPIEAWTQVSRLLVEQKKPFFLLPGKHVDPDRLRLLQMVLPWQDFYLNQERQVLVRPPFDGENHPVLQIYESTEETINAWEQLPPVFSSWYNVMPNPESKVLLSTKTEKEINKSQSSMPILMSRHVDHEKSIVFLGEGLFRWSLIPTGLGGDNRLVITFIQKIIHWLSVHDEDKQVRLSVDRFVYRPGDPIIISAQVYDETYQPVRQAEVHVKLLSANEEQTIQLPYIQDGLYKKMLKVFQGGMYQGYATAHFKGKIIGKDSISFSISHYNPELSNTKARPEVLENISQISGGKAGPPDSLDAIVKSMQFPIQKVRQEYKIQFYHHLWILIGLLALLFTEWFIRKRKGML